MIKSMTGFGQLSSDDGQSQIHVEVKSLNSTFLDLNLRLPKAFAEKEMEVRNLISESLERGKVSVSIEFERVQGTGISQSYNESLFVAYYAELKKLAAKFTKLNIKIDGRRGKTAFYITDPNGFQLEYYCD